MKKLPSSAIINDRDSRYCQLESVVGGQSRPPTIALVCIGGALGRMPPGHTLRSFRGRGVRGLRPGADQKRQMQTLSPRGLHHAGAASLRCVVGARRGAGGSGRRRAEVVRGRAEAGAGDRGPAGAAVDVGLHPVARGRVDDARRSAGGHEGYTSCRGWVYSHSPA
jgi:hypothetical protein